MKKPLILLGAALLCLAPLSFQPATEAKRPENRVSVSPKHYDHDLHQFSPIFDIKLKCKTVQWTIEDLDQQDSKFDIRDKRGWRIDPTILADLTHGSITPNPAAKNGLYVSNVRKAKRDFTLSAACIADDSDDKNDKD